MRNIGDGSCRQGAYRGRVGTQVFYADGEKKSTEVIQAVLHHLGARVIHFGEGEACLAALQTCKCHLLISNARRPAVEGLELLLGAKDIVPSVSTIMMVDHGDIQTAIRAMKSGAIDCLERPPEQKHLLPALEAVLQASAQNTQPKKAPLSPTERQVLHLILQGLTTAETARTLHRSRRTIEVHRGHIMRKLEADGMVDLVRKCAQLGFLDDWP